MTIDIPAVKMQCRNVWKVYGRKVPPSAYIDTLDPAALDGQCNKLRSQGSPVAVCNANFDVKVGEVFVVMGLSGSGKSTLVRCLSGLIEPTHGEIWVDDQDLAKFTRRQLVEFRRHKVGMVFQNFGLLPHLTVLENVAFPLKMQGVERAAREERARELVDLVELKGREHSFPRELSGGQQQRVGFARSLAVKPEIWFLDEPFSALDPLIRRQMQDEFLRLQKLLGKTVVFITHDFPEALRLADRIAIMKDGRIIQLGTPSEVLKNPADDYVAKFTQDAPMIQVLTAADIAKPLPEGTSIADYPPVPHDTLLVDLSHFLRNTEWGVSVTNEDGQVIGVVTPQLFIQTLDDWEAVCGA